MPRMPETSFAVCQTSGCWWTASGPKSYEAAEAHEREERDHHTYVGSGMTMERTDR